MVELQVSGVELRALLVEKLEVLSSQEFEGAENSAKRLRAPIERVLVDRGLPQTFIMEQLAASWGVSYVDLKTGNVKPDALALVKEEFARQHTLVPFELENGSLKVAMCDPRDPEVLSEIQQKAGRKVVPYLAPAAAILRAHLLYKGDLREMLKKASLDGNLVVGRAQKSAQNLQATEILTQILEYAAVCQGSDIHIEPFETEVLVRCRIDGVLQEVLSLPVAALSSLVSRIKVLANMRIDEKRIPQDGRFSVDLSGLKFDLRVSSLPAQWGEKIVIRVLSKEFLTFDLEHLGLIDADYQIVLRNILRPHGMVLITGPTGCGKSTSLYCMLARLGAERRYVVNISTVEDPAEYMLPRVNQVSSNEATGLTFPVALRALLRQDPDVIMVGEIRDRETADIAVRAALVGRLLFSTLHTNDSTSAVLRLVNIGVEPFLLASTLSMVIGQRLVRRICANCRESADPSPSAMAALRARPDFEATIRRFQAQNILGKGDNPLASVHFFKGKGCAQCQGSGFRGRLGLFEIFEVNEQIRSMIVEKPDAGAIRSAAVAGGMKTLFHDGLAKVFLGESSLEEVARVAL